MHSIKSCSDAKRFKNSIVAFETNSSYLGSDVKYQIGNYKFGYIDRKLIEQGYMFLRVREPDEKQGFCRIVDGAFKTDTYFKMRFAIQGEINEIGGDILNEKAVIQYTFSEAEIYRILGSNNEKRSITEIFQDAMEDMQPLFDVLNTK